MSFLVIEPKRDAVAPFYVDRNVLENILDFFVGNILVVFKVKDFECYPHLLLDVSHQGGYKKLYELVMIDSFVSVGVDLAANSVTDRLRDVQVLFSSQQAEVVFSSSRNQSIVDFRKVRDRHFLKKVGVKLRVEFLDLDRIRALLELLR